MDRETSGLAVKTEVRRAENKRRYGGREKTASTRMQAGFYGGYGNIPLALAGNSALASINYTLTRYERLQLYRYFSKTDPYVGRALDIHTALPLSKMQLVMPKSEDDNLNKRVLSDAERLVKKLQWWRKIKQIVRLAFRDGDVFIWFEWDEDKREWSRVFILPSEYCHVRLKPYTNEEVIVYARPLIDTQVIHQMHEVDIYAGINWQESDYLLEPDEDEVPEELKDADATRPQLLNTDPYKGSCIFHFARNQTDNDEYGESLIERIMETLLGLENLKNAQLQISSRNMSPKHLVSAMGISSGELGELRDQVDLSLLEPDFPIVTNYHVDWQTIGVNERLLSLDGEYHQRLTSLAVGLGLTLEFLTGEGLYSGQRINLQVLNTEYLDLRESLAYITEEILLKPMSWAKGYVEEKKEDHWRRIEPGEEIDTADGQKVVIKENGDMMLHKEVVIREPVFPSLKFNRLTIRDDAEMFEYLFQLYLKGSLDADYLMDLWGVDSEENAKKLIQSVGTVKDSQFNMLLAATYQGASVAVLEGTDLIDRIVKSLNLKKKEVPLNQQQGQMPGAPPAGPPGAPPGTVPAKPESAEPRPGQDPDKPQEQRGMESPLPEGGVPGASEPEPWYQKYMFKNKEGEFVEYHQLSKDRQVQYAEIHLTKAKPVEEKKNGSVSKGTQGKSEEAAVFSNSGKRNRSTKELIGVN